MNNNFIEINSKLTSAYFDFAVTKNVGKISVEQIDEIVIKKIYDNHFFLDVKRSLKLTSSERNLAEATFNVRVNTESTETESSIAEKIKEDQSSFGNVFSKLSLVISQITSHGQYGPIVTPPLYDKNTVVIRKDI